jgi:hypothetical protein
VRDVEAVPAEEGDEGTGDVLVVLDQEQSHPRTPSALLPLSLSLAPPVPGIHPDRPGGVKGLPAS